MSALASYLKTRARHDVSRLTPEERVRLALALGDDDVRLFCIASGETPESARQRLSVTRRIGRRSSTVAGSQ